MSGKPITHRPLLMITLLFGLGIVLEHFYTVSMAHLLIVLAVCLAAAFFCLHTSFSNIFIIVSLVLLGILHAQTYQVFSEDHYFHIMKYYRGGVNEIKGEVISDVKNKPSPYGRKTTFVVRVEQFKTRWGWKPKSGKMLVNSFRDDQPVFGDVIHLKGKIHRPFEYGDSPMSYREFLQRKLIPYICSVGKSGGIKTIGHRRHPVQALFLNQRKKMMVLLDGYLTPNESGIIQAVLLGERSGVPKHVRELFVMTGTAHILAISGLHIGIIAFLFFLVIKILPVPRRLQILLTIVCVALYGCMVAEGRASVMRASVMTILFLWSLMAERESNALNTLALAGLVILLHNPLSLFDVGFQLSFFSVWSILAWYPQFNRLQKKMKLPHVFQRKVFDMLAVSLAAWLGVAGCVAYYFGVITPISVVANLVVIPLMFWVVALGFGLLAVGGWSAWLGGCFAFSLKIALNLMVLGIYGLHNMIGGVIFCKNVNVWYIIAYYAIMILLIMGFRTWGKIDKSWQL